MNPRRFVDFLNGRLTSKDFESELTDELADWKRSRAEHGRAAHVVVAPSQEKFAVSAAHVRQLLSEADNGDLSGLAAGYLVDALLLGGETFVIAERRVTDTLEYLSETEEKGALVEKAIQEALEELSSG